MANTKISAFTAETDVANITGFAAFKTVGGSSTNVKISGSEIESTLNLSNFAVGTLAVGRGGTGATTFTANGILIGNVANAISATAELANGELLIGSTGNAPTPATLTAGTGVTVTNGAGSITITNSAPDQTVALNAGTGITTSGTYPNFTITNSAPDQTVALTGGTGISTSGTYPNFTITNDSPNQATPAANDGSPSTGQLQYNNGSNGFAATSDMVYTTDQLKVQNSIYLDGNGPAGGGSGDAGIVKLGCEAAGASHYVGLEGPTHAGSNSYIIKFPDPDPAVGKILKVNSFSSDKAVMEWADAGSTVTESFIIAASDETTALSTGTAKATFRMPYAFTLTSVRASVGTAPVGSVITVDIKEAGSSILSTKITIAAGSKTSVGGTAPVISDSALADDAEITIDINTIGSSTAGAGLKVTLIGNQ